MSIQEVIKKNTNEVYTNIIQTKSKSNLFCRYLYDIFCVKNIFQVKLFYERVKKVYKNHETNGISY